MSISTKLKGISQVILIENPISGIIILGAISMAAILTVPLTASIDTLLMPYGTPALTMPFVLASWIFIAAKK